jgi:hypothetical protein
VRKYLIAAAVVAASTAPAIADNFDLTKGELAHNAFGWSKQLIAVKNNTNATFNVTVECGFFRGNALIDTGSASLSNVQAGQTAYEEVTATDPDANRVECRVSGITPAKAYKKGEDF